MIRLLGIPVSILGLAALLHAADSDPIKDKLEKAKAAFSAECDHGNQALVEEFNAREKAARNAGDKKAVDQVKSERTEFERLAPEEKYRLIPPANKAKINAARTALRGAYEAAIKDYTRIANDAAADQVEKEFEKQKAAWALLQAYDAPKTEVAKSTGKPAAEANPKQSDGFIDLFNGRDLSDWGNQIGPAKWEVIDGSIVSSGHDGHIARGEYKNFFMRAQVMLHGESVGDIQFRDDGRRHGYCAELSLGNHTTRTGTLYRLLPLNARPPHVILSRVKESPVMPDEWFNVEIKAENAHIVIAINGRIVGDVQDDAYTSGQIVLRHEHHQDIKFRHIQIKELP